MRSAQSLAQRTPRWKSLFTLQQPHVLIWLITLAICSNPISAQEIEPSNTPATILGTVVNSVTHAPVSRALVYSADNHFAMFSDNEGHFEFQLPAADENAGRDSGEARPIEQAVDRSVFLLVRKPGFLDVNQNGMDTRAVPGLSLTISLVPEGVVHGNVTTSSGDPAAGLTVQLFNRQVQDGMARWGLSVTAPTNSNGEYRFAGLRPGAYKLVTGELLDTDPVSASPRAQPYGFPPVCYPGVDDFSAAATIQLTAGGTFQANVSLTRKPYYRVRIPVAGDIINGVGVTVSVQGHRNPGYSLGYNQQEHRIEGLLPSGNYQVEANTYSPTPSSGIANIAVAGVPIEGPGIILTKSGSIEVNVDEQFTSTYTNEPGRWSDGKHNFTYHGPRLYLQISAVPFDDLGPPRNVYIRPPVKQEDNSLVLEGLEPGKYAMRFYSSRGYVASATMGGADLLHEPLVFTAGSSAPIEVTMRDDGGEIEGTLLMPGTAGNIGSPARGPSAPNVSVYCIPLSDSAGQLQELRVSPGEKFQMPKLAPGIYRLLAFSTPQPDLLYRDAEAMKAYENQGEVVHLEAGQKQSVQLSVISAKN
ncbi:MAG: carboxypeptidase-like regulatory domain-containing protein [Acidobacteriota bacterium]|nr:carboxypeptidase-like regulatory domain-containing protein [Acidobacteriota bacterium]